MTSQKVLPASLAKPVSYFENTCLVITGNNVTTTTCHAQIASPPLAYVFYDAQRKQLRTLDNQCLQPSTLAYFTIVSPCLPTLPTQEVHQWEVVPTETSFLNYTYFVFYHRASNTCLSTTKDLYGPALAVPCTLSCNLLWSYTTTNKTYPVPMHNLTQQVSIVYLPEADRRVDPKTLMPAATTDCNSLIRPSKCLSVTLTPPRVLCFVMTSATMKQSCHALKRTWGSHCTTLLFFSDKPDPYLNTIILPVSSDYKRLMDKLKAVIKYLLAHDELLKEHDWFMKADDDCWVNWRNLITYLYEFNVTKDAYYLGRPEVDGTCLNLLIII